MLPAALMVPTVYEDHLLLRAHTAPPAAPKVFATNTRCPYMVSCCNNLTFGIAYTPSWYLLNSCGCCWQVFFEAVDLDRREAGIPLATLRNAGAMRRIHEDTAAVSAKRRKDSGQCCSVAYWDSATKLRRSNTNSTVRVSTVRPGCDHTDTKEPGSSPSRLQTLSPSHRTPADAGLSIGSASGSTNRDELNHGCEVPLVGVHVEVYSVSDNRWYTGSIVAHLSADEVEVQELPRGVETDAGHNGYVCVEYNHGRRQKVVLWGDQMVVRLSQNRFEHGTLDTVEVQKTDQLGTSSFICVPLFYNGL